MDVEEAEARMSEQDAFSEQDRLQESVLEIKYNYAVMLVVLGLVFLYRSLSSQDLLICRSWHSGLVPFTTCCLWDENRGGKQVYIPIANQLFYNNNFKALQSRQTRHLRVFC